MRGWWWSGVWDFLDDCCVKVTVGGRAGAPLRGSAEWEGLLRTWDYERRGRWLSISRGAIIEGGCPACESGSCVRYSLRNRTPNGGPVALLGPWFARATKNKKEGPVRRRRSWNWRNRTRSVRTTLLPFWRLPVGIFDVGLVRTQNRDGGAAGTPVAAQLGYFRCRWPMREESLLPTRMKMDGDELIRRARGIWVPGRMWGR